MKSSVESEEKPIEHIFQRNSSFLLEEIFNQQVMTDEKRLDSKESQRRYAYRLV